MVLFGMNFGWSRLQQGLADWKEQVAAGFSRLESVVPKGDWQVADCHVFAWSVLDGVDAMA
jgi:hypothetical protein